MAAPMPGGAVKEEDEGNMDSSQSAGQAASLVGQEDFMDIFRNDKNLRELLVRVGRRASGTSAKPALPPPVQQQQPPPPPPPPAHGAWGKRPAAGPPPGFAGVRQPPQKHLPPPPGRRAQHAQAQHKQPPQPQPPPQPASAHHRSPSRRRVGAPDALAIRKTAAAAVFCGVCNVKCMTQYNLREHEAGKKHRDKVASIAGEKNVRCQVCDVLLASELNVTQHYAGRQHRHRLQLSRRRGGVNGGAGAA
ncbi:zinc finger protein 385A-like [Oryza brachyantha]|uniref:zinc finger protein 385A-like n=1 Tax=Oryza brachyantha TaxID=4533 RepID=UPI001AD97C56|nr:zinc finger protein 385A-like [Oryza brachyantha]